jgi:receptor protein-tyrosine kinase
MSLIEQAARRLEQLREAGSQVAGELAYPAEQAEGTAGPQDQDDIIERAARKMRQSEGLVRDERQPAAPAVLPQPAVAPPVLEPAPHAEPAPPPSAWAAPTGVPALDIGWVQPAPDAEPAVAQAGSGGGGASGRRSREVIIDFERIREGGLLTPDDAQSRLANELRVIKRPLLNNCAGKGATPVDKARLIMITSALPGEGKSFVSMNLALSIAMERDSTVLLIEGDPTRPALASMLGIPATRGLMDLLVNPGLDVGDVMMRTNLGRLSFIPAGTRQEHATELLASNVMENLVSQLYERYPDRVIIFDSPPLLAAPEPRVLAQHMGQIIYVVESDQTAQSTVQEALGTIESCPVVMAVLNKATSRDEGYYYSTYYSNAPSES